MIRKDIDLFNKYIKKFNLNDDILLDKYKHTFRVVGYGDKIAKSIGLDIINLNLVRKACLFHDIGRFVQYKDHSTLDDKLSLDHGDKSYEIIYLLGYRNETLFNAVKYHNKVILPNNLNKKDKLICNIVRDADKLDIMFTQSLECKDKNYTIREEVLESFINNCLINDNYEDYCSTYYILRNLAFIFDLNFKESINILIENDLINYKLNLLKNVCCDEQFNIVKNSIYNYLYSKFKIKL